MRNPATLIHELSEYIEHFHLADIANTRVHNRLIPGNGAIDFRGVFDAMDDIGYNGFVTVDSILTKTIQSEQQKRHIATFNIM